MLSVCDGIHPECAAKGRQLGPVQCASSQSSAEPRGLGGDQFLPPGESQRFDRLYEIVVRPAG